MAAPLTTDTPTGASVHTSAGGAVTGVQAPPARLSGLAGALRRSLALPTPTNGAAHDAQRGGAGAWHGALRIGLVAAQLALVLAAFRLFHLEEDSGFVRLAPFVLGGFLVNAALPLRWRLPFFLALSLAAFGYLLGPAAALVVPVGLGLIALCHLPLGLRWRVALLVAAGAALAVLRLGLGPGPASSPWVTVAMPVIGSIFMFRLLIYVYDLERERAERATALAAGRTPKPEATLWERLSYFFLLPNACFLLFPVVDYQAFRRGYYAREASEVYQKGVFWMFRGLTHLLLYRVLYYYVVPSPPQVEGLGTLVLFMVGTYLLYLKVSGLFHLITGVLGLFGFDLPETYHRYLLASGFNDFWRRSNIYWKDFMTKVFYYPAFTRLHRRWKGDGQAGMARAIALSTAFVFLVTWLLHSYQWFWLLGAFPLTVTDAAFWSVFGGLVVINSVWQLKRGKRASLSGPRFSLRGALVHALKVLGMFVFISVLWSFWYSPSPGDFFAMASKAGQSGPAAWALLVLGAAALVGIGVGVQYLHSRGVRFTAVDPARPAFGRGALVTGLGAAALLVVGLPQTQRALGPVGGGFVASLQEERLTTYDAEQQDRGYYDALMTTNTLSTQVGAVMDRPPPDWKPLQSSESVRQTGDIYVYELVPNTNTRFKRAPLVVNQWGMRDQEYTQAKPEGTYRIALFGASIEMGSGVNNDQTFEAVTEQILNEEWAGRGGYDRYEILNFAVGGYSILQHYPLLDTKAALFEPDMVLYTAHAVEDTRMVELLAGLIERGITLPPYLETIRRQANVDTDTAPVELRRRLQPFEEQILREGYDRFVTRAREIGALPVMVFVPRVQDRVAGNNEPMEMEVILNMGRDAGFYIISINDAYDDVTDATTLMLAPWDGHPNVGANRLLATRLYEVFMEHRDALGLTPAVSAADATGAR